MNKQKNIWVLTPFFGTIAFIILYLLATLFYPGGSQIDKNSKGFSWVDNYWCNLLSENSINGKHNSAKPFAMAGMLVLCLTLTFFWFLLSGNLTAGKTTKDVIRISGTLAMAIAFLLFTNINHDLIINLASISGLVATIGSFIVLYKARWYGLLTFGLLNLLLVAVNNFFYYNNNLIIYLPVIQKVTFAAFLIWVCCVDMNLYHKASYPCNKSMPL